MPGREQLGRHDRGQTDGAGTDDRHGVAGLDAAVEDAALERGREDVGEKEHLLVRQLVRHLVDGRVCERHARVLGLKAVDQVAEDPATSARAESVTSLLAEAAAPARRDARDEDTVALHERRDRAADGDDGTDRLVAEDRPRLHLGHIALEDVQIGPADGGRVDPDDRVCRIDDGGVGNVLPGSLSRPVVDEGLHRFSFPCLGTCA